MCTSLVKPVVGTAYQQGKKKTHIGSRTNLPARFFMIIGAQIDVQEDSTRSLCGEDGILLVDA